MKKKFCIFWLSFVFLIMGGCKAYTRPTPRIVSAITIDWTREGVPLSRHYTDTKKIEDILLYLRLLKTEVPEAAPQNATGDIFKITVKLINGKTHVCQQRQHRYFRWEQAPWQAISPEQASKLYGLLEVQSDL
ncbi:MAG: hypothetical protein J6Q54_06530 [Oscillospiraceae bacterium]|nr:hypothetical protein [Oscillospiraceae bacterium]